MGFGPQLVDLDGDGHIDLLSGSWPGEIFWFRGGPGRAFAAPEMLRDREGEIINIGGGIKTQPDGTILVTGHGAFESDEQGSFVEYHGKRIDTGSGKEVWVTGTASAVHAVDWDLDGDLDLLVGDITGSVWFVRNDGTKTEPAFAKEVPLLAGLFKPIRVEGDAGPFVADWDGDGDHDLLVGCGSGSVWLFRNTAPAGKPPSLAAGEPLVPPGLVAYGEDAPREVRRGHRSKVCAADWNGDGRIDLLVGDVTTQKPEPAELTPETKAEHDRIRKELEPLTRRESELMERVYGPGSGDDAEEQERLQEELGRLWEKMQELRAALPPEEETHGWVWLFLRKQAG